MARVGTGRGAGSEAHLARLRAAHPDVHITVGGGIARIDDVLDLKTAGASGVLIGSALHDGRIGPRELVRLVLDDVDGSSR